MIFSATNKWGVMKVVPYVCTCAYGTCIRSLKGEAGIKTETFSPFTFAVKLAIKLWFMLSSSMRSQFQPNYFIITG